MLSDPLRVASCMAPNADNMCRELAAYLASRLGMAVTLVETPSWQERERRLDAGEIDLCWICGVPYVEKVDDGMPIVLSVAPVMQCVRYGDAPIYFSDVVVHAESAHRSFADLCGKRWAFNEARSHSGFNVVRYHLASLGHTFDYFAALVEAGTHQAALRMVISGDVAGAAIDSTVIEAERRNHPELLEKVRAIAVLGPSPAPPWVFSPKVPYDTCTKVTGCLADMHRDRRGAAVLAIWGIRELRVVTDDFYDPIRRMTRAAGII